MPVLMCDSEVWKMKDVSWKLNVSMVLEGEIKWCKEVPNDGGGGDSML